MIEYEILTKGQQFEIRALRRPQDDESLVKQYLNSLQQRQQKKLHRAIQYMADRGHAHNSEKCKKISGHNNLFELKEKPCRLVCFYDSHRRYVIVITHGFDKKGDPTPRSEIDRAIELRESYLSKFGKAN